MIEMRFDHVTETTTYKAKRGEISAVSIFIQYHALYDLIQNFIWEAHKGWEG